MCTFMLQLPNPVKLLEILANRNETSCLATFWPKWAISGAYRLRVFWWIIGTCTQTWTTLTLLSNIDQQLPGGPAVPGSCKTVAWRKSWRIRVSDFEVSNEASIWVVVCEDIDADPRRKVNSEVASELEGIGRSTDALLPAWGLVWYHHPTLEGLEQNELLSTVPFFRIVLFEIDGKADGEPMTSKFIQVAITWLIETFCLFGIWNISSTAFSRYFPLPHSMFKRVSTRFPSNSSREESFELCEVKERPDGLKWKVRAAVTVISAIFVNDEKTWETVRTWEPIFFILHPSNVVQCMD